MQYCHWYDDGDGGRVLLPGCFARLINPDVGECTCPSLEKQLADAERRIDRLTRSRASLQTWHDQIVRAVYDHLDGRKIMKAAADRGAPNLAEMGDQ